MNDAAQPLNADDGPLSPWWIRTILIVMGLGFAGLITITMLSYSNAPPIPAQVVDAQGVAVFSGDDIISQVWPDGQWQHLGSRRLSRSGLFGRGVASHGRADR